MAVRNCWVEDTVLPLYWAGALPNSLSPMAADDGTTIAHCMASWLVNIAHISKINDFQVVRTCQLADHHGAALHSVAPLQIKEVANSGGLTAPGEVHPSRPSLARSIP
jgi:hypothetical protein